MKRLTVYFMLILLIWGSQLLGNEYYFVFLNTNPNRTDIPKEQIQELQNKHLANIDSLYRIGKLVAAGPFEGGGGLFILVAPTIDSAKRILESDPAIAAKRFKIEVFPFEFNIGATCPMQEPFEMTDFYFIRYFKGIVDLKEEKFAQLYQNHLDLYQDYTDSLILDGVFNKNAGFVQIIDMKKAEKIKQIIRQDSLVNQNYYYTELKKLWIAKGTFCDK